MPAGNLTTMPAELARNEAETAFNLAKDPSTDVVTEASFAQAKTSGGLSELQEALLRSGLDFQKERQPVADNFVFDGNPEQLTLPELMRGTNQAVGQKVFPEEAIVQALVRQTALFKACEKMECSLPGLGTGIDEALKKLVGPAVPEPVPEFGYKGILLSGARNWPEIDLGTHGPGHVTGIKKQPKIIQGLSPEQIERVMKRAMAQFRYVLSMESDPNLNGKVVLKFTIDSEGSVQNARADDSWAGEKCGMVEGLVRALRSLHFPAPVGGKSVDVTYPLLIAPNHGRQYKIRFYDSILDRIAK